MIVGEIMSQVVELEYLYVDLITNDIYENYTHYFIGRPLTLAPLIYAKLHIAAGQGYEVYWDHFRKEVTVVTPTGKVHQTYEEVFPIPRRDRIRYVDSFVEAVLERE
jgi:hypothetical protein